jgi:hypothetical protein
LSERSRSEAGIVCIGGSIRSSLLDLVVSLKSAGDSKIQ